MERKSTNRFGLHGKPRKEKRTNKTKELLYCFEKRSGKEKIMALTLNKEYYFISKEYSNMVLNVYGTSSVANGRNVCLYEKDENGEDKMQLWKYQYDSGYGNRLHCVQNTDYVLDRSSGMTNSCANNAHTYKKDLTGAAESAVTFVAVSGETNVYRIRLTNRVNNEFLFLTAANNNGTLPASAITSSNLTTANKNVYWAAEAASGAAYRKQCWEAEEYTSGGSSGGGESGGEGDTYTINGKTIPLSDWPVGSYWTTDGKPSDKDGSTSIKLADGSKQCAGFAKYVYEQIWGSYTYGHKVTAVTLEGTSSDFDGISVGARINCDRRKKKIEGDPDFTTSIGNHSMIILSKTSNGIVVYECNHDDKCGIGMRTITYRSFYLEYKNIKNTSYTP